jgi:formylmethanofuran--tetrahydromethanopterin N-formyltransferase
MQLHGIDIEDTFAEAFDMKATRIVITAATLGWARTAATTMSGFATSVIACGVEAAIEHELAAEATPDGRPGVSVLVFAVSRGELQKQLVDRIGQCVMTCPTTSVFAGLRSDETIPLGSQLRYFGDGLQISKMIGGVRYWRIPVLEGEFVCEENLYRREAIGGGNFLVQATTLKGALESCEAAVDAMARVPGIITPFPGGIARSGSKVGSKYKSLPASTNSEYCPTLRGIVPTQVDQQATSVLEIVIDGLDFASIADGMRIGIESACAVGCQRGVTRITAGNYGGKLGGHYFPLRDVMNGTARPPSDDRANVESIG